MTGDYDPEADAWGSYHEALRDVRERVAAGGPGWSPKPCQCPACVDDGRLCACGDVLVYGDGSYWCPRCDVDENLTG
jgi:hypothetical protein